MVRSRSPRRRLGDNATSQVVAAAADPLSWLFLNPNGPTKSALTFGVLRQAYGGRVNSALEYGWHKAHPQQQPTSNCYSDWSPTAERVEVILPRHADDMLADPALLLDQMDRNALECDKALLIYLTLPLSDVDRIHVGWESARAFVRCTFARDRDLATVLCLHAPATAGAPYPLHAHCLIVPRSIGKLGIRLGRYDEELTRDSGQDLVDALWTEHCRTFR